MNPRLHETFEEKAYDFVLIKRLSELAQFQALMCKNEQEAQAYADAARQFEIKSREIYEEFLEPVKILQEQMKAYALYHFVIKLSHEQRRQGHERESQWILESLANELKISVSEILSQHEYLHSLFGEKQEFQNFDSSLEKLIALASLGKEDDVETFQRELQKIPEGPYKQLVQASFQKVKEEFQKRKVLEKEFGTSELNIDMYLQGTLEGKGRNWKYYQKLNEFYPDLRKLVYGRIRELHREQQLGVFRHSRQTRESSFFDDMFPRNPGAVSHPEFKILLHSYAGTLERRNRPEPTYILRNGDTFPDYFSHMTGAQPTLSGIGLGSLAIMGTASLVGIVIITSSISAVILGPKGVLITAAIAAAFATAPNLNHWVFGNDIPSDKWLGRFIVNLIVMLPIAALFQGFAAVLPRTTFIVGSGLLLGSAHHHWESDEYFESIFSIALVVGMASQATRIFARPPVETATYFNGKSFSETYNGGDFLVYDSTVTSNSIPSTGYKLVFEPQFNRTVLIPQTRTGISPPEMGGEGSFLNDGFIIPRGRPRNALEAMGAYYEQTLLTDPALNGRGQGFTVPDLQNGWRAANDFFIGDPINPGNGFQRGGLEVLPHVIQPRTQPFQNIFTGSHNFTSQFISPRSLGTEVGNGGGKFVYNLFVDPRFIGDRILPQFGDGKLFRAGSKDYIQQPFRKIVITYHRDRNGNVFRIEISQREEESEGDIFASSDNPQESEIREEYHLDRDSEEGRPDASRLPLVSGNHVSRGLQLLYYLKIIELEEESNRRKLEALQIMAEQYGEEAIPHLLDVLKKAQEGDIKNQAHEELAKLTNHKNITNAEELIRTVERELKGEEDWNNIASILRIISSGDAQDEKLSKALEVALGLPVEAFSHTEFKALNDHLQKFLEKEEFPHSLRRKVAQVLFHLSEYASLDLDRLLRHPNPHIRMAVVLGLGHSTDPAAVEILERLALEDNVFEVRLAAITSLRYLPHADQSLDKIAHCDEPALADRAQWATYLRNQHSFSESSTEPLLFSLLNKTFEWGDFTAEDVEKLFGQFELLSEKELQFLGYSDEVSYFLHLLFYPTIAGFLEFFQTIEELHNIFLRALRALDRLMPLAYQPGVTSSGEQERESIELLVTWCFEKITSTFNRDGFSNSFSEEQLVEAFVFSRSYYLQTYFYEELEKKTGLKKAEDLSKLIVETVLQSENVDETRIYEILMASSIESVACAAIRKLGGVFQARKEESKIADPVILSLLRAWAED
ncbi:MAG: HEAT repeat domain-containing protein, partial [Deltaproteobacteria bacterium]|nr:HEAT repeat domain-containing protein [Deltaproteobacteria bacterium]